MKAVLKKHDLLYPELSYRIIGSLFSAYNELGAGHHERYYQLALAKILKDNGIDFKEQVSFPIKFRGSYLGRRQLDFLVEEKVILKIKKGEKFSKAHIDQVLGYLKTSNLKLAILANFSREGVQFKRIVNFD